MTPRGWDNYSRNLVVGWTRSGMTPLEISRHWPWPATAPSPQDVLKLVLELSLEIERAAVHQRESETKASGGRDAGERTQHRGTISPSG